MAAYLSAPALAQSVVDPKEIGAVRAFRLLSQETGWILAGQQILWTSDEGTTWDDVTPSLSPGESMDGEYFLNESHGWVLVSEQPALSPVKLSVARTTDSGKIWSAVPIAEDDRLLLQGYGAHAEFSFADERHGWVLIDQAGSSASSLGHMYKTTDSGLTWSQLPVPPVAGEISFTSPQDGWLAGGARFHELYVTHDGGELWTQQTVEPPRNLQIIQGADYSLPSFTTPRTGALPVAFEINGARRSFALYSTVDAGANWKLDRLIKDSELVIQDIQMADITRGWMLASSLHCGAQKTDCVMETLLLKTEDGGSSFAPILQYHQPLATRSKVSR